MLKDSKKCVLHRPEPHQHIPQRFCLIGHIGLPGQDHAGNLDAIIGLGYLLEEWLAVLRPDQLGFIALIDQIDIDGIESLRDLLVACEFFSVVSRYRVDFSL